MPQRFLAIGECMIEMSPTADGTYSLGFAGDTFNTAWYARQLTSPETLEVSYFSAVGDDHLSSHLVDFMQDAGIDTHMVKIDGVSSGLYMIFLDQGERSFQYWRSTSAARRLAEHLDRLPGMKPGDIVYFSGITVAILPEDGRHALQAKLQELRRNGVKVVFDPNLRPRLWDGVEEMKSWTMKSAAVADFVLPSFADEAEYFDDRNSTATADRYLRNGAGVVVVKDGAEPVFVKTADGEAIQYQPREVAGIVDTTAAGDSFNAAFIVDYLERSRLQEAVEAGCALSAHVIGHRGALVPVPSKDQAEGNAALRA